MPAYDRPIEIRISPQPKQRAVGAVIEFTSTDVDRIQAWLNRAAEAGIIAPTVARTYDPEYGTPVWYVP